MAVGLKKSPAKFIGLAVAGASMLANVDWGGKKKKALREAQAEMEKQKQAFEALDTSNLYADVKNPYQDISMENVYEDMTVNQQQAQFQAQQQAQARANILQDLRGAAGGSGIAGLAQAMASQAALGTQQISADIGAQESQQQIYKARGAEDVLRREQMKARGEATAELQRIKGAESARGLEYQKQQGMMSMAAGQLSAAQEQALAGSIAGMAGPVLGGVASFGKGLFQEGGVFNPVNQEG